MQIKVNPDENLVTEIREKIRINGGHCCCAIVFNEDNKCMCKDFRDKIAAGFEGYCDCGLYEVVGNKKEA